MLTLSSDSALSADATTMPGSLAAAGAAVAAFSSWGFSLFAVLAACAVWTVGRARRKPAVYAIVIGGLSSVVATQLGRLIKAAVAERRPCQLHPALARWSTCPANASFPSDHSVYAGALAITTIVLARLAVRAWIGAAGVVLALCIGASRVFLGVHYWWDVLGGYALGGVVAAAALFLLDRWRAKNSAGSRSV